MFYLLGFYKIKKNALISKKCSTFAIPKGIPNARVAESVDALVSNTSSFTGVPVRPRPHRGLYIGIFVYICSLFSNLAK